jgi:menaquinone-specific isochorismate synthase
VLFEHDRVGLAGRGVAARIQVDRSSPSAMATSVHAVLDTIDTDDEVGGPGCGPVALGALPFAPTAAGELVVPAVTVGRGPGGTRWLTTVTAIDEAPAELPSQVAGAEPIVASDFSVRASRSATDWCAAVAAARDELRAGVARKVVLAREVVVTADAPVAADVVLRRLRRTYPGCMLFAASGFVGATPELLVSVTGDIVRSHPMAGTAPRSADPSTDARLAAALLASTKDREEHRITIDMVHDTLLPWCSYLDEEAEPSIVPLANVQHLATLVEGRLSTPAPSVVELVGALHPTPAVCGAPRDVALELIARHEHLDRGRYAGPVGWVDRHGNGEWAVGIRSAELAGPTVRLFAGVGVVADSDPEAELAETQAKLQALLGAVLRP